jgi:hypothetical protein
MIQAHTLSWTGAAVEARLRVYRRLLTFCLAIDVLLGLFAVLAPSDFASLLGQPEPFPEAWTRAWGAILVGASLLCLAGRGNPTFYRWPNWGGIALRLVLAVLFLLQGPGFLPLALWEAASGALLLIAYYRLTMADLARRP